MADGAEQQGHGSESAAYGARAPYAGGTVPIPTGMATAALVVGIVGMALLLSCWGAPLALLTSPVAIFLGVGARRRNDRGVQGKRSEATAGMTLGIVGLVLAFSVLLAFVVMWTMDGSG